MSFIIIILLFLLSCPVKKTFQVTLLCHFCFAYLQNHIHVIEFTEPDIHNASLIRTHDTAASVCVCVCVCVWVNFCNKTNVSKGLCCLFPHMAQFKEQEHVYE